MTAFSTASVPALKNAAFAGPRKGAFASQPLGELDVRLVRDDGEVGVGEPRQLLGGGLDDAGVCVAGVEAADAAGEVDERVAVDVGERGAPALVRDDREHDRLRVRDHALLPLQDLLRSGGRESRCGCRSSSSWPSVGQRSSAANTLGAMEERDLDPDPLRAVRALVRELRATPVCTRRRRWRSRPRRPRGGRRRGWCCSRSADERGFAFHTNYESRKGGELAANPHAALLFHWQPLGRQVRVEGRVERVPTEESEAYFRTRPLGSRLAAWASPQSRPLADRARAGPALRGGAGAVRRRRAAAADLGRLPARRGRVRVLAAPRRPPARPRSLRARRRRLGKDQAGALGGAKRHFRDLARWKVSRAGTMSVRCRAHRCLGPARHARRGCRARRGSRPSRADASPSTTGTWRIRRSPISRAASRICTSASTVTGLRVITSPTLTALRSVPLARERQDVALGEDADEPAAVADGDRADPFFQHPQHRQAGGVVRLDGHDTRPHHVADGHWAAECNGCYEAGASAPGV